MNLLILIINHFFLLLKFVYLNLYEMKSINISSISNALCFYSVAMTYNESFLDMLHIYLFLCYNKNLDQKKI